MNALKSLIKKYFTSFAYFYSILRSKLLIVILLSIVVGLLDSLGLTMFLPLLQMADGEGTVDLGGLSFITNGLNELGITLTIRKALAFLAVIFLVKGFVVYKVSVYGILTRQKLTKLVRMSIVDKLPVFAYNQFVKTDIGKIQNIFLGEISRLTNTYTNYISMMQGAIMIIVYMTFSFLMDWQFALLVCVGGLLSNLIFNRINKLTKEKSKNISKVGNIFSNVLIQYVHNFKYLKATGKVIEYRHKVEKSIDQVQYEALQMGMLNSKVSAFREPMLIGIVALVILAQITFFDARVGTIMVSLLLFYRALTSVVSVQNNYNNTLANQGAIDNIISFQSELNTYAEKVGKKKFDGLQHSIEVKEVVFKYGDTTILDTLNFIIPKNKTVAFVGESGSGKTTLVNVIIKLLNVNNGAILIDGTNLNEFNQFTYQKKIGYISQEPTVFNATLFDNITFWAEPTPENKIKFEQAIQMASLSDFIDGLKEKEQTLLGNNGINLSGGQRQRVSIARELFKEVELLILDEATSALDSETESEIQQNIDALKGKYTLIIIAHRLATIKNADTIYLLQKGKIKESGSFEELCQASKQFKRMVELQEI